MLYPVELQAQVSREITTGERWWPSRLVLRARHVRGAQGLDDPVLGGVGVGAHVEVLDPVEGGHQELEAAALPLAAGGGRAGPAQRQRPGRGLEGSTGLEVVGQGQA